MVRRTRQVAGRRPRLLRWAFPALLAAFGGGIAGIGVAAAIRMPRVDAVAEFTPGLTTQIYDRDGRVFASYARERRYLLREGEVPELLQNALVAAEDRNFFRHGGIDAEGVARAALRNLRQGEIVLGGSTITMQLARKLFLTPQKTWRRKVEEALLAVELEKTLSKQQILTLYCNVVFLGHGSYGMEAAARHYFGKSVGELALPEAATLAGIIQQPSRLSPYRSPDLVLERRDYVLRRMLEEGFIGEAEHLAATESPLLVVHHEPRGALAAYFAEEVRQHLEARYGAAILLEKGLQATTTLDPWIQRAAEEALRRGLVALDRRKGWRGPLYRVAGAEGAEGAVGRDGTPSAASRRLSPGAWSEGVVLAADAARARVRIGGEVHTLLPQGMAWTGRSRPSELLRPGDVAWFGLEPGEGEDGTLHLALQQEPRLEGAVLVLESASGAIRALVGGWDFQRSKFDRATQARRQVGSAFKPLVYGAALETGFTPADTLFDAPAAFPGAEGQPTYSPRNYYRRYYGILTLRRALENSINVTSVKLMNLVGVERVIDFARRCGLRSELPPYPSLALGSADLTPLELASAYATIANRGFRADPYLVERVAQPDGRILEEHALRVTPAVEPAVAAVLIHMLEGVVDRGTAKAAAGLETDLAGKTGTTDEYTDAWFVGFTPTYTILTWVGYDQKRSIGKNMTGAEAALPMWREIVARGLAEGWLPRGERFTDPPGVVRAPVEYSTGLLAGAGAQEIVEEAFVTGTQPTLTYEPRWAYVLSLPWFQQRPYYLPKIGEAMPEDIRDWSLIERTWAADDG